MPYLRFPGFSVYPEYYENHQRIDKCSEEIQYLDKCIRKDTTLENWKPLVVEMSSED